MTIAFIIVLVLFLALAAFSYFVFYRYIRETLSRLAQQSEDLGWLDKRLISFHQHLEAVYELERFYGDQDIKGLLRHTLRIRSDIEFFRDIIQLGEEEQREERVKDYFPEEYENEEEKEVEAWSEYLTEEELLHARSSGRYSEVLFDGRPGSEGDVI